MSENTIVDATQDKTLENVVKSLTEVHSLISKLKVGSIADEIMKINNMLLQTITVMQVITTLKLSDNFEQSADVVKKFKEKWKNNLSEMKPITLEAKTQAVDDFIKKLSVFKTPKSLFLNVKAKGADVFDKFKNYTNMPKKLFVNVVDNTKQKFEAISNFKFKDKQAWLSVGTKGLDKVKSSLLPTTGMFMTMKTGIMGVGGAFKLLTASAGQFLATMLANPVTWLILGIALAVMVVINAFKMLSTSSNEDVQSLMAGLKAVGDFIMNIGKIIFNVFVAVVTVVITVIAKIVAFARENFQGTIITSIKEKIFGFVDIVAKVFKWLFETVDKFCGTNFSAELNLKATTETDGLDVSSKGSGITSTGNVDDLVSQVNVTQTMPQTVNGNYEQYAVANGTEIPDMTGLNGEVGQVVPTVATYASETKETIVEKLTLNAKSVFFVSEKEYQEVEKSKTTKENPERVLNHKTYESQDKNYTNKIKELTKTVNLSPVFNFTGDVRIREDLETIYNFIVGKLEQECQNGTNVTQHGASGNFNYSAGGAY